VERSRKLHAAVAVLAITSAAGAVAWFELPARRRAPEQSGQAGALQIKAGQERNPVEQTSASNQAALPANFAGSSPDPTPLTPTFDVVRVEPNGEAVVVGRSAPSATVDMIVNGGSHAQIAADEAGFFALLPPPLQPGSHEVVLEATQPDGTRLRSRESVTIVTSGNRTTKALVAVGASSAPVVQLSSPGSQATASQMAAGQRAMADASGSISAAAVPEVSTVIVSRRENLWRISERMYGAGHRYKAIYEANREQIRTPHVIHPGQSFIVPSDAAVRR